MASGDGANLASARPLRGFGAFVPGGQSRDSPRSASTWPEMSLYLTDLSRSIHTCLSSISWRRGEEFFLGGRYFAHASLMTERRIQKGVNNVNNATLN